MDKLQRNTGSLDSSLYKKLWPPLLSLPKFRMPSIENMGLIAPSIPQILLLLSNSIYTSAQFIKDFLPDKNIEVTHIGLIHLIMNMLSLLSGGVSVCTSYEGYFEHYTFMPLKKNANAMNSTIAYLNRSLSENYSSGETAFHENINR